LFSTITVCPAACVSCSRQDARDLVDRAAGREHRDQLDRLPLRPVAGLGLQRAAAAQASEGQRGEEERRDGSMGLRDVIAGMVRASQLLHPQREPAVPRPAATVLLLRDGGRARGADDAPLRHASFAPGAYVFPGGGIDAADAQAHGLAARRPTQRTSALTQAIAAIRESFEELGVLLARHADGRPADARDIAALDRAAPFAAQCRTRGLVLAADQVFVLAHWITDRDLPRRFDVPFLVARVPEGQQPDADEAEQFEPLWVRPAKRWRATRRASSS
jgi:8-oxo-dGTP pyrophosphatase MutT (NUDIX family)